MINLSSHTIIKFSSRENSWYSTVDVPNFIDLFILYDPKTYIINAPRRSSLSHISKIIGRKSI
jgi:hypothetical protein